MADPISLASGLITLVAFALQGSKSLHQTIESFQSHQRTIRELREELQGLDEVLQSLREVADSPNVNLASLKLPLLRCGKACKDFENIVAKCAARSGSRASFRDWARLRYMGNDINGFKNMLAGYKSTISIALGDANIRAAAVTTTVLAEYKELIENTTSDLEEHLQDIDHKLRALSPQAAGPPDREAAERQRIQEERDSTKQCLAICANVSAYIDQIQPEALQHVSPSGEASKQRITISARHITTGALNGCKGSLTSAATQLQSHLEKLNVRLQNLALQEVLDDGTEEHDKIREEMESVKQCLAICTQASEQATQQRTVVVEDVSAADDGHQVIVATLGDLISVKHVKAGARSAQWLGQMSDTSLQQLSRHRIHGPMERLGEPQDHTSAEFDDRYGTGHTLSLTPRDGKGS